MILKKDIYIFELFTPKKDKESPFGGNICLNFEPWSICNLEPFKFKPFVAFFDIFGLFHDEMMRCCCAKNIEGSRDS